MSNMDNNVRWFIDKRVDRTIESLKKKNMFGMYIEDKNLLFPLLDDLIPNDTIVGVGDSMTLFELGVIDYIRKKDVKFLDKYSDNLKSKDKKEIYRANFSADTFLTGTNAVTEKGELFNIDGNGSRVAPMMYGPDQVIVVVGTNKIVKDLEEAEKRVRQIAAPIDAKRLNKNTPCTKIGFCVDCNHEERICNDFVVITGQFQKDRIKVLIVNDSLGY